MALQYIERMFTKWNPWVIFDQSLLNLGLEGMELNILILALVGLLMADLIRYRQKITVSTFLMKQNMWFRWIVLIGMILAILVFGVYGVDFDSTQFIYFDF